MSEKPPDTPQRRRAIQLGGHQRGIVGQRTTTKAERARFRPKPEFREFHGQLYDRVVLAKGMRAAAVALRQSRNRVKNILAKQARKYNDKRRHKGRIDVQRLRGRRTLWGA